MALAKDILYETFSQVFHIQDNELYRKLRNGEIRKVICKSSNKRGYCQVTFQATRFMYHRIMYCLAHQVDLPNDKVIDHLDGDPLNNNITNLRLVSTRENMQNSKKHRLGKLPGTREVGGKISACITINGQCRSLGVKSTKEVAHQSYLNALKLLETGVSIEEIQKISGTKLKKNTLPRGLSFDKNGKIRVRIIINGLEIELGKIDSIEMAINLRKEAEARKAKLVGLDRRDIELELGLVRKLVRGDTPGIQLLPSGKYSAILYVRGFSFKLGVFPSMEEALDVQERSKSLTRCFRSKEQFKQILREFLTAIRGC